MAVYSVLQTLLIAELAAEGALCSIASAASCQSLIVLQPL